VTWWNKKKNVIFRSSAEAEYKSMTHTTYEMMWLKNLLLQFGFCHLGPMPMFCNNQSAIYIAQNKEFHERTKYIEVDCHLVRDAWTKKVISLPFTLSSKQLADLLTKVAFLKIFSVLCSKLGMVDIYAPA